MKIVATVSLAASVLLGTPVDVSSQFVRGLSGDVSDTSVVSVSASADEYVTPDRAVVFLQILSADQAPEAASLSNGEARTRTIEALVSLGYDRSEISLWGYGSGPASSGGYGPPPQGSTSYEARSGLRVVVDPLDRLDAVVASALLAGASISTVELESDGLEDAMTVAAERAVSRARTQATAMARAAGGELGDLVSLTTTPDYNALSLAGQRYSMYPGAPGSQGVVMFPTDGVVRLTVQATWVFVRR